MAGRKRILYYNHTRKVSGGERMLLMMLSVLDKAKYEAVVACPLEGDGMLDALLRDEGIETLRAPLLEARFTSNPVKLLGYCWSFAKTIAEFRGTIKGARPDLLHAASVRAGIVATLATIGMKVPVLWHVQDDLPRHVVSTPIRLLAYCSRRTRLVAVSKATAKAFAGRLDFGARLTVLYNAIDRERFPRKTVPLDAEALAFREELGLTPRDFLAVTVGMIHPRKGLLELVELFGSVVEQNPAIRAHLAVVGAAIFNQDHLYEEEVRASAAALTLGKRLHFTGARQDVAAILRAADLFVLAARREPFGLVILEAMSSGTPVVANGVGGIPEIVTDGVTGRLFSLPPRGFYRWDESLGEALARSIRNPLALGSLANAAYEEVLPRFTMESFAASLNRVYEGIPVVRV